MAFRPRVIALLGALACLLGHARPSAADETPSLFLEPSPAGDRGFGVERAGVRGHLLVSARLFVDYANEPLVLVNPASDIDRVVVGQTAFHALASFSIRHRFAVNVDVPFAFLQAGRAPVTGETAPRPDAVEFGDIRLGARARILGSVDEVEGGTALAIAASLWVPTATDGYAGDGAVRARAAIVAEGASKRLYWAANGGVRTRPSAQLPGVVPTRIGTALSLGLAGGFFADARRDVALGAELAADLTIGGGARFLDPRATIGHLFVTGHYRIAGGPFEMGAAFGPGFGQGAGSADFRALFLVGFAPEEAAPPPDRDEDGVPDKVDTCIDLVGVPSPDPLLHGCPEAPPDRDGDAIPDQNDACPTLVGEATGVRATHGCPRRHDADEDGVVDRDDACPKEPGEPPPGGNGCPKPKEPPPVATVTEQQIEISQQVQFETGTAVLRPESDAVLAGVARVLAEHPEIELVEVQGHTDDTGPPDLNRRLGQDRANSVVVWLAMHGVARERLSPVGYGSDKPIAANATEEGRTRNRRVEFRILRKKPEAPREAPKGGGAR